MHASGNDVCIFMCGQNHVPATAWRTQPTVSHLIALYAAHATSFSRASRHLLLTRVTLPAREPPARGAAGQARHFDVRTAGCAWSRDVKIRQLMETPISERVPTCKCVWRSVCKRTDVNVRVLACLPTCNAVLSPTNKRPIGHDPGRARPELTRFACPARGFSISSV